MIVYSELVHLSAGSDANQSASMIVYNEPVYRVESVYKLAYPFNGFLFLYTFNLSFNISIKFTVSKTSLLLSKL